MTLPLCTTSLCALCTLEIIRRYLGPHAHQCLDIGLDCLVRPTRLASTPATLRCFHHLQIPLPSHDLHSTFDDILSSNFYAPACALLARQESEWDLS